MTRTSLIPPLAPKDTPTRAPLKTGPLKINANTTDDPSATVLYGIAKNLLYMTKDSSPAGSASPAHLISQGMALMKQFRPADPVQWAIQATACADFWAVAARFQPHLAEQEVKARKAMKAAGVTVSRTRR